MHPSVDGDRVGYLLSRPTSSRLLKLRFTTNVGVVASTSNERITKVDISQYYYYYYTLKRVCHVWTWTKLPQGLMHLNVDERGAILYYLFIFYHGVKLAFSQIE